MCVCIYILLSFQGSRSYGLLAPYESLLSVIDDVPDWYKVENFWDEIIDMLCCQSSYLIDILMPQLMYARFSYKQLVEHLYEGQLMLTSIDFYMATTQQFLSKPIMVIKPQFNTNKNTQGRPKFVFKKEYFFEQDSYLDNGVIPLKFMFNGCNYYVPFLQADAACIVRVGTPIL